MNVHNRLGLLALLLSTSTAFAARYTEKTFLAAQPAGVHHSMHFDHHTTKHSHSTASIQPFYQASTDAAKLGKYFGLKGKNSFTVGNAAAAANPADIDDTMLIHRDTGAHPAGDMRGTVSFSPKRTAIGAVLNYQVLNFLNYNRFFLNVALPFVQVETTMGMKVENGTPFNLSNGQTASLENFFAGKIDTSFVSFGAADPDHLLPLEKARIAGKQTAGGLADIDVTWGIRMYESQQLHISSALLACISTVKEPNGDYLFEPVLANGGHGELGVAFDMSYTHAFADHLHLNVGSNTEFRYGLAAREHRTLGIKNLNDRPFAQYYALGWVNQTDLPLIPAANVLTQPLTVTPGSQVTQKFSLNLAGSAWDVGAGFGVFHKQQELVTLDADLDFDKKFFAFPAVAYQTNAALDPAVTEKLLTQNMIDVESIITPEQLRFSVDAHASMHTELYQIPVAFAAGASYEWADRVSALSQYTVWLKAALYW